MNKEVSKVLNCEWGIKRTGSGRYVIIDSTNKNIIDDIVDVVANRTMTHTITATVSFTTRVSVIVNPILTNLIRLFND